MTHQGALARYDPLVLDFLVSQIMSQATCIVYKLPNLWYFAVVAQNALRHMEYSAFIPPHFWAQD